MPEPIPSMPPSTASTTVVPVVAGDLARQARQVVAEAEEDAPHGELVDERERHRLDRLCQRPAGAPPTDIDEAWRPSLALVDGHAAGYGALLLPDEGTTATAELVVARHHRRSGIGHSLLNQLEATARRHDATRLSVWSRDEDEANRRFAESRGYVLDRRLDVLARGDQPVPDPEPPDDVSLRPHRPGDDDAEVIRVLNTAFPDTQRPWNQRRLDEHRDLPWFDPAGVLVAEDASGDQLLGLHWTKRRGAGTGEVHILGIAPEGQASGLGRALLRAGLRHLYAAGDTEVILWMDAGNEPARGLYESEGFTHRWSDAAYARDLTNDD